MKQELIYQEVEAKVTSQKTMTKIFSKKIKVIGRQLLKDDYLKNHKI